MPTRPPEATYRILAAIGDITNSDQNFLSCKQFNTLKTVYLTPHNCTSIAQHTGNAQVAYRGVDTVLKVWVVNKAAYFECKKYKHVCSR